MNLEQIKETIMGGWYYNHGANFIEFDETGFEKGEYSLIEDQQRLFLKITTLNDNLWHVNMNKNSRDCLTLRSIKYGQPVHTSERIILERA